MTASHVLAVAERLLDPEAISIVGEADAASLNRGLAGTALLHARLATLDKSFAHAAIRHWTQAAACLRRNPTGLGGIQGGRGGVAASLIVGSTYLPDPENVRATTAQSAKWLSLYTVDVASQYDHIPAAKLGTPWHIYDAITGLTGLGRVLLAAAEGGHDVGHSLQAALTTLTAILAPSANPRPGWWLSREGHPRGVGVDASGAAATGLAHGVAGPLAFLSTAYAAGWNVPGQAEAITHAASWLLAWRTPEGIWQPNIIGSDLDNNAPPREQGRKDGWCYGTPGITTALHIAAKSLQKPEWAREASTALEQLGKRAPQAWDTDGPTLCHGYAGVLQATARTSRSVAKAAAEAVVAAFDPNTAFGFQHHDGSDLCDEPGFLTGASGVALALADHNDLPTPDKPTAWDCLLNLS